MEKKKQIVVSPFTVNVIDLIGVKLTDCSGNDILIEQSTVKFVVKINGVKAFENQNNIIVSSFLNDLGIYRK